MADAGNAVLRCVETPRADTAKVAGKFGRVTTFAGSANRQGAADGWEGTFRSPTAVVQLSSGEFIVADTGSHTLRLVEVGGKGPLVSSEAEEAFKSDVAGRRAAERRKQPMLAKLTTIAGKPGVAGCADGGTGDALLNAPTALALTGKGAAVLFLTAGDVEGGGGGPPLLRRLTIGRSKTSGRTNDLSRLVFRVTTVLSFGEAPRVGPTSLVDVAGNGKELLVADGGRLLMLELDRKTETYTATSVAGQGGANLSLPSPEVYLGAMPSGVGIVMHCSEGVGALHRLFSPPLSKKAERRFEKLIGQCGIFEPLRAECAAALSSLDSVQAMLLESDDLLRHAILMSQRAAFAAEAHFLLTATRPARATPQFPAGGSLAYSALLTNAPSLRDCLSLLAPARLPPSQVAEVRHALCSYLRGVTWPVEVAAAHSQVEVLLQMADAQPGRPPSPGCCSSRRARRRWPPPLPMRALRAVGPLRSCSR